MDIDKDAWTIGGLLASIAAAWGTAKATLARAIDDQRAIDRRVDDIKRGLTLPDGSSTYMLRGECGQYQARTCDQFREIKDQIRDGEERSQRRHEDLMRAIAGRMDDGR